MPEPEDPLDELRPALARPDPPRTWRERAEHLADATGTSPARLAAGALVVVVAVAVVAVVTRPAPAPPEVALPFATTAVSSSTTSPAVEPSELLVHVAGAVTEPGVKRLEPGARVIDAVDAAGGLGPDADPSRLNLAAPVSDGERVYVPAVGEEVAAPMATPDEAAESPTPALVDLNTADAADLEALPGIGPATSAAILEHRGRIGRFGSVDQLLDVRGIGPAKLEQLRPLVTV